MALLGTAAVAIWIDIDPARLAEHDRWHSFEHLPERLGVPGFLRGRRCAAFDPSRPQPRFVLYELEDIAVTRSKRYMERLNDPTPWSKQVMAHCRISRTLCRIAATHGQGLGNGLLTLRLAPQPGREDRLRGFLADSVLPEVAKRDGVVGAHLLQKDTSAARPATSEEKLRQGGVDSAADWAILVEGFDAATVAELAERLRSEVEGHGAQEVTRGVYTVSHVMDGLRHG